MQAYKATEAVSSQTRAPRKGPALSEVILLVVALLLNFGLRYGYMYHYATPSDLTTEIGGDGSDYLQIAYALAQTGQYGRPLGLDVPALLQTPARPVPTTVEPDGWRPPLWPLVLAGLLKLADFQLTTVFLLRFLLDLIGVALFYWLLRLLNLPLPARALGLVLLAVHPTWLFYSATLLSEPLTLVLQMAVAVSALLWLRQPGSRRQALIFGVTAGIAILGHPFMLLFPLLLLAVGYWRRLVPGRAAALALGALVLVLVPWVGRNMMLYHTIKPILTTSQGMSLGKGWNSTFLATFRNTTAEVQKADPLPASVNTTGLDAAALSDVETGAALHFMVENWRLLPALVTRKFIGALTPIPEVARPGFLETGRMIFQTLAFIPMLWVLFSRRADYRVRWLMGAALAAYLFMAVATMPSIRYRFPLAWGEILCISLAATVWGSALAQRGVQPGRALPVVAVGADE